MRRLWFLVALVLVFLLFLVFAPSAAQPRSIADTVIDNNDPQDPRLLSPDNESAFG